MDHDFPYECRRIRQNKPPCWNNADELPIISGNVEIDDSLSNAFVTEPGEGLGDRFGFQQPYRIVAGDLPDNGVQVGKSVDINFLEQVIAVGRRKLAPTDSTIASEPEHCNQNCDQGQNFQGQQYVLPR